MDTSDSTTNRSIRDIDVDGKSYVSILDLYKYHKSSSNPSRDWVRERDYLIKVGFDMSHIILRSLIGQDGKQKKLTPFVDAQGLIALRSILGSDWPKPIHLVNRSEVLHLHPLVNARLKKMKFKIKHHFVLPSGKVIDFVAESDNRLLVVECKNSLRGKSAFSAIGQVFAYSVEYDIDAQPMIATYWNRCTKYMIDICEKLNIELITV